MTRDAFNAKLEIDNGDNSPLEEIKVTIEIRETYGTGELAMSQFAIGKCLINVTFMHRNTFLYTLCLESRIEC